MRTEVNTESGDNSIPTIDVTIVFDAEGILNKYGEKQSKPPAFITTQNEQIHMITKKGDAISGQGGSNLKIRAYPSQNIRWYATTLTLNSRFSAVLYSFQATKGGSLISKPVPKIVSVDSALPDPPENPKSQPIKVFFWETTIEEKGTVVYHFDFLIFDNHAKKILGFYTWDPEIQIS